MSIKSPLNPYQVAALQWIGGGCLPQQEKPGFRVTARALEARKLVVVSRAKGEWSAQITLAGKYYLRTNTYPRNHWQPSKPTPRKVASAPKAHAAADGQKNKKPIGSMQSHKNTGPTQRPGENNIQLIDTIIAERASEALGKLIPGMPRSPYERIPTTSLSRRVSNVFSRNGILTWQDLANKTIQDLADLNNVGILSLREMVAFSLGSSTTGASAKSENKNAQTGLDDTEMFPLQIELREFETILRNLATWAVRERNLDNVTDLLLVNETSNPPTELLAAWNKVTIELNALADKSLVNRTLSDAYTELLRRLSDNRRIVLERRLLSQQPSTLQEIADIRGVTREAIRIDENRLKKELSALVREPDLVIIYWRAWDLRTQLGSLAPNAAASTVAAIEDALRDVKQGHREQILQLLLLVGGPYKDENGWFIHADGEGIPKSEDLWKHHHPRQAIELEELELWLSHQHVRTDHLAEWVATSEDVRLDGNNAIKWSGTVLDKAEALLELRKEPATSEQLVKWIGEGHSARSVRQRLQEDSRFMRVDKQRIGLRAWGAEEYSGIADEIARAITENGGEADLSQIILKLVDTFGVSEASIRAFADAPMFIRSGNGIRLRTADEPFEPPGKLSDCSGAFKISEGKYSLLLRVDSELLRGSGRPFPGPLATALGLRPGDSRTFIYGGTELRLTWPMTSARGPALGSSRKIAQSLALQLGDLMQLRFSNTSAMIEASGIRNRTLTAARPLEVLELVTGVEVDASDPRVSLASSLTVAPPLVDMILRQRGDGWIANLLPEERMDNHLDDALSTLAEVLNFPT